MHAILFASLLAAFPAQEKSPTEVLEGKGLVRVGSQFLAKEEQELLDGDTDGLRQLYTQVRDALEAKERLGLTQRRMTARIDYLERQDQHLRARLPELRRLDSHQHNAVVDVINAGVRELNALRREKYESDAAKRVAVELADVRQKFFARMTGIRDAIAAIDATYGKLEKDDEAAKALEELEQTDRRVRLGPSSAYRSQLKKLKRYTRLMKDEAIPVRRENNSFIVPVTLNGKVTEEFTFDTGADSISLSWDVAVAAGINPEAGADTRFSIADGSVHSGKRVYIKKVQVGKFVVEDVVAGVWPESLPDAPLLLGGSFINNFSYDIDQKDNRLILRKLED